MEKVDLLLIFQDIINSINEILALSLIFFFFLKAINYYEAALKNGSSQGFLRYVLWVNYLSWKFSITSQETEIVYMYTVYYKDLKLKGECFKGNLELE